MQKFLRLSFALLIGILAGCSTAPQVPFAAPAAEPVRRAAEAQIKARCARLKAVLAPLRVRETGFSHRAFAGFRADEVCRFIAAAGFNRICLQISSASELDEGFIAFLKAAKAEKLPVDVMLRQEDFLQSPRGQALMRRFEDPAPDIAGVIRRLDALNGSLPGDAEKISRVILAVAPHKLTGRKTGQIFAWSGNSFGPGLDNDMLMRQTLDMLRKLDPGSMKLVAAVPDFYHELAVQKKLTCGTVADFAAVCKKKAAVLLLSTGNKPSQIIAGSRNELISAGKKQDIQLGIELADHTSVSSGKLRRRDWNDLVRIIDYVVKEHKKYPEFCGIMLTPLPVLKYLIMEQD